MVIMLGDNLYGSQGAADFVLKFERPYKPLLDAGVKFYASLGNHDKTSNDSYSLFNMGGERYYTYARKNVRFFVLDTNYLDPGQVAWIERALRDAREPWKIAYFHHPLYSDGGRHGSSVDLRVRLEPIFVRYGVNVVYSGHDHVYERVRPQKGIYYFVSGAGGELRQGDLKRSALTAAGFDQDRSFMLNEIAGDDLLFQVISRTGQTVDQGVIHRELKP
jgi:3',5'-cyclic AMP phosphodiesterase CpdA